MFMQLLKPGFRLICNYAMDSEKNLEARLVVLVKKLGGWAIKFLPTFVKGLPDRIVLMPGGKIYFVELKSEGRKPTPLQVWAQNKIRALGFDVRVIDTYVLLDKFIDEISTVSASTER